MQENHVASQRPAARMQVNTVTDRDIEETIVHAQYYVFPGTTVTVCCLNLRNGFNVIGESACVDPRNFDAEVGRKLARLDAERKVWPLEGYLLKERFGLSGR